MAVQELNREQLTQLKQHFLIQLSNEGRYSHYFQVAWDTPSYGELANADALVTDEEVIREYAGVSFVAEDFSA